MKNNFTIPQNIKERLDQVINLLKPWNGPTPTSYILSFNGDFGNLRPHNVYYDIREIAVKNFYDRENKFPEFDRSNFPNNPVRSGIAPEEFTKHLNLKSNSGSETSLIYQIHDHWLYNCALLKNKTLPENPLNPIIDLWKMGYAIPLITDEQLIIVDLRK